MCGGARAGFPISDFDLIRRAGDGDSESYAELVRSHYPKIFCLCFSLLKNQAAADDAAQDVFLNAYRAIKTFRGTSSFSTWLHRIAANRCLDLLRRRVREKEESLEALAESREHGTRQFQDQSGNPDQCLEDADLIEKVMSHLSPDYRLILTLRERQGLSYQELSETLECSLDAVKARLRRARLECEEIMRHFSTVKLV